MKKPNKTNVARVKSKDIHGRDLLNVRGFIVKSNYPEPLNLQPFTNEIQTEQYICHCDDVRLDEILEVIGNRKFISVDEVKHTTRLGMGACRGKRCIKRLKLVLKSSGISIIGDPTPPRAPPLSNQVSLGDIYPKSQRTNYNTPP